LLCVLFAASSSLAHSVQTTSKNKDLVILRLCNELLRRLSRAEDPVFCGRVYVFLFQSFPLGDKSSVNLRGNFHVENVTTFEDYLNASAPDENVMELDIERSKDVNESSATGGTGTKATESNKSDGEPLGTMDFEALYPVFWSLQNSFSNPPRLFEAENFKHFQQGLEATLAKFKEVPKVIQSGDSEHSKAVTQSSERDQDGFASTYNPKYLTSRDLFRLEVRGDDDYPHNVIANHMQLSDLAFQRHILVQALVLIDFLLTLTETAKKRPYYENGQKAMQYSFTLREEDVSPCHPFPSVYWLLHVPPDQHPLG
jgi:THO complex subunit 1